MSDIWDEKPPKRGGAFMGDDFEWKDPHYDDNEIDAFHEKVKTYIKNLLILIDGHEDSIGRLTEKLHAIKSPALAIRTRLHSLVNYPAYENAERVEPKKEYMVETLDMANEVLEILQSSTPKVIE